MVKVKLYRVSGLALRKSTLPEPLVKSKLKVSP
jgi:hypothetical protein